MKSLSKYLILSTLFTSSIFAQDESDNNSELPPNFYKFENDTLLIDRIPVDD